jgi:hypothetical protein
MDRLFRMLRCTSPLGPEMSLPRRISGNVRLNDAHPSMLQKILSKTPLTPWRPDTRRFYSPRGAQLDSYLLSRSHPRLAMTHIHSDLYRSTLHLFYSCSFEYTSITLF